MAIISSITIVISNVIWVCVLKDKEARKLALFGLTIINSFAIISFYLCYYRPDIRFAIVNKVLSLQFKILSIEKVERRPPMGIKKSNFLFKEIEKLRNLSKLDDPKIVNISPSGRRGSAKLMEQALAGIIKPELTYCPYYP